MLKMDVINSILLQQKLCSRNVEIPGGRGGHQRPPWNGNSEGVGGCKPKTFRGRGMDIFWNHTFNGMGRVVQTQRDGEKECKSSGVGRDVKHT